MARQYFTILRQNEIEKCQNATQIAVFMAIKSWTANGKEPVSLSLRKISNRAKTSPATIMRVIPKLVAQNLIEIVSKDNPTTYKVFQNETLPVSPRNNYVSPTGAKYEQVKSNKNNHRKTIALNDFNPTDLDDFWSKADLLSRQMKNKGGQNYG